MNNESLVSMAGILMTTLMALISIRKTAEANRVSNIHMKMTSCLVDTVAILGELISLLDDIDRHVIYENVSGSSVIETAYIRYWKKIGPFSKRFKEIQAMQKLVFPKKLYDGIQELIKEMNEARNFAKYAEPNNNNIYPDTNELRNAVNKASLSYRKFVNDARLYLGTNTLAPIVKKSEEILKAEIDNKESK